MKNLFIGLAATMMFAACNSETKESESTNVLTTDTTSLYNNGISSDTATLTESVPVKDTVYLPAPKEVVKQKTSVRTTTPKTSSTTTQTTTTVPGSGTVAKDTVATAETTPTVTPEKKGMSSAAKGAVIGGVGGAVGGAILSKKKGKGAIIGGAVGAAGGYILGRKKDKKNAAQDTVPQ
ncbi:MAG: YMGG-like glycine zipper-containing protein [Ginsengibacter sp.]